MYTRYYYIMPDSSPVVFMLRDARGTGARDVIGSEKANLLLLTTGSPENKFAVGCDSQRRTQNPSKSL